MAKLKTPATAGFNAGNGYSVKYIPISKIVIDPEISGRFRRFEKIVDIISQSIIKDGFHKEEPVTLWEGLNVLLDGHQRYAAAKKAGEVEIPYVEKHFDYKDDAILYTFERQAVRRNLTGEEILAAAKMLPDKKSKNGEGRSAEVWAKKLGISATTMYRAKSVLKNASEEDLQAVREGKASVKKIYKKTKQPQEIKLITDDSQNLLSNDSFLKEAIILLVEAGQKAAAELLVNHFLEKNEKRGFYDLLPDAIQKQLPRLPLVAGTLIDP